MTQCSLIVGRTEGKRNLNGPAPISTLRRHNYFQLFVTKGVYFALKLLRVVISQDL